MNEALRLAREELNPDQHTSSSVMDAVKRLANNLDGPAGPHLAREALLRRDHLLAHCQAISDLPEYVHPSLASFFGPLLNQVVHRIADVLPVYIDACEQAVRDGPEARSKAQEAAMLRRRAEEFQRNYNAIAKKGEATGHRFLVAFIPDKLLGRSLPIV